MTHCLIYKPQGKHDTLWLSAATQSQPDLTRIFISYSAVASLKPAALLCRHRGRCTAEGHL